MTNSYMCQRSGENLLVEKISRKLDEQVKVRETSKLLIPRTVNLKLANGIKMWKGKGNTTSLLFSLKRLEIVHQERRGQIGRASCRERV